MPGFNKERKNATGNEAKVLIPVDFSTKWNNSINVGFELAKRLEKEVVLLHASALPMITDTPQFPDVLDGLDNESAEIEMMELGEEIHNTDYHSMENLKKAILKLQESQTLPQIKFETEISVGMPEEVIQEYCTVSNPEIVVMSTRSNAKRREELIGSVTAEVIDNSFIPVLTVPEEYVFNSFKDIVRICAFCYCDEGDYDCISRMMQMFGSPSVEVYLFPATEKIKNDRMSQHISDLYGKLIINYPNSNFHIESLTEGKSLRDVAEEMFIRDSIQMILAPNRKRNAISRFFNPGLPHKILYEIDFPMLAIPV